MLLMGRGALDTAARWSFILIPFVLLGVLLGVGALINLVAKHPVFNGAAVCFWIVLGVVVAMYVVLLTAPRATFQTGVFVGEITGALIPALVTSFFLARRFRKKARMVLDTSQPG